jgi:hypothetical protein|tara:strand:+ start:317 stop:724 length:408 start_codon:yes stop_codon:yes gene_type:complete
MLTLLGSVLGFSTSFLPKVMDYFQDKSDKKHELEVMTRQAEINLDATAIDANIREVETIHEHDSSIDGAPWVNTLRASVRPIITYMFFAEFVILTIAVWGGWITTSEYTLIWNSETQALWAAIAAFWFGGRQFRK